MEVQTKSPLRVLDKGGGKEKRDKKSELRMTIAWIFLGKKKAGSSGTNKGRKEETMDYRTEGGLKKIVILPTNQKQGIYNKSVIDVFDSLDIPHSMIFYAYSFK